ncbi:hypothetical protein B0H13DRAFT_2054337 [Mycena leptocephala]|nr:hypothetical protein B0H13DRAFT_2054337 [Mycena leptocephala]
MQGNINVFFLVYASMLLVPRTGLTEWSFEMPVFPAFPYISAGIPRLRFTDFFPFSCIPFGSSSNSDSSRHWGDHRGNATFDDINTITVI